MVTNKFKCKAFPYQMVIEKVFLSAISPWHPTNLLLIRSNAIAAAVASSLLWEGRLAVGVERQINYFWAHNDNEQEGGPGGGGSII